MRLNSLLALHLRWSILDKTPSHRRGIVQHVTPSHVLGCGGAGMPSAFALPHVNAELYFTKPRRAHEHPSSKTLLEVTFAGRGTERGRGFVVLRATARRGDDANKKNTEVTADLPWPSIVSSNTATAQACLASAFNQHPTRRDTRHARYMPIRPASLLKPSPKQNVIVILSCLPQPLPARPRLLWLLTSLSYCSRLLSLEATEARLLKTGRQPFSLRAPPPTRTPSFPIR